MTPQEAIKILDDKVLLLPTCPDIVREAVYMAISALEKQDVPEINVGDLISRNATIDALKRNTFRLTFAEEQNCEGHVAWSAEAVYSEVMEGMLLDLPSAQPEQNNASEFWRKRADFYSDMCMNLIGEMGKGVKIESVKISENGIEFIKEQPPAQPEIIRCKDCKYWQDQEEGVVEVPICARPANKYEKFPLVMLIGGDGFCSYAERKEDGQKGDNQL